MNIKKLARHLKEFTLDEIEMIAECDCKNELEQLLNSNKIVFEQGVFKIIEEIIPVDDYSLFINFKTTTKNISIINASQYFLENYVQKHCKKETIHQYKTILNCHIIPYFTNTDLHKITPKKVCEFYYFCKNRELQPRRIKNIMALLNQMLKYFQNLGYLDRTCSFQVKRLSPKNEFSLNRVVFE